MDKHTQQRPRARTSKQPPAQPVGDPAPLPQEPVWRPVFAPITPDLQAAHDRLSEAHGRAALAVLLGRQERAAREAAESTQDVSARQQGEEAATRQQDAADEEAPR